MKSILALIAALTLSACGAIEDWWNALPEDAVRQPDGTWIGTVDTCWRGGIPNTEGCRVRYRFTPDGEIIERLE